METLAKLFGGVARVKIMRLFLLNTEAFTIEEVVSRSRVMKAGARRELGALAAMGFIKQKTIAVEGYRGAKKRGT
jgi:predicted transcriptional regulator